MTIFASCFSRALPLVAAAVLAACGGGGGSEFSLSSKAGVSVRGGGSSADASVDTSTPPPLPTLEQMTPVQGAKVTAMAWIDSRTLELTIASDAFAAPVKVEVFLPAGYLTDTKRRWAFTYYLGGTNHNQTTFRNDYSAYDLVENYPSLVVSPSGDSGYWSDWFNNGAGGPPKYETFVMDQLLPLIDANFRTVGDRAHRAIMGDSMGGYGALMIAARHPDKFAAAASLSGTVDTNFPTGMAAVSASPALQMGLPDSIYGPRLTQEVRWRGHNPWDLARNLAGMDLLVITGNGILGLADGEGGTDPAGCVLEAGAIYPESVNLHNQLTSLGIAHAWEPLPWGCHSKSLFRYEIKRAVARFEKVFAAAPTAPTQFDFRAVEPQFAVYGWSVQADPARALEFMDLRDVSATGLTVIGSGLTTITTPGFFRGRSAVDIHIEGAVTSVRPDSAGRVVFAVDLGPANASQQYTLGSTNDAQIRRVTFTPR
ncbi:MAG: alpha/beta hydrolase family protein [Pseudomonadota bacterium]